MRSPALRAVAACILLLVAGACAGGEEERSVREIVVEAPERVRGAGSARMVMTTDASATVSRGDEAVPFETTTRIEGVVDFGGGRGELEMTLDLPSGFGLEDLELRPCRVLVEGAVVYLRLPEGADGFEGKRWARVDASAFAGFDVQGFGAADPTGSLEYLKGFADDLEEVGADEVRGTPVTRYRGTVVVDALLDRVPDEQAEGLRAQLEQLGALGLAGFPVDAWIDDEGLARRLEVRIRPRGEGGDVRVDMRMDLFDFGEGLEMTLPGADEVSEVSDAASAQNASRACLGTAGLGSP